MKEKFARYIEKHNDLEEYLISFVELKQKNDEFLTFLSKKLKSILKEKKIYIPFNIFILKTGLFSLIFLLLFIIVFTNLINLEYNPVYFDKLEYVVFPERIVSFTFKGGKKPDTVLIYSNRSDTIRVSVKKQRGYFVSPKKPGFYILTCNMCVPSRLKVIEKPQVKVRGYALGPIKRRKLEGVDYLLSGTKVKLDLSFKNTDSAVLSLGNRAIGLYKDTSVVFELASNCNVGISLFTEKNRIDTMLYNLFLVKDDAPRVVILYPSLNIVPVMDDTVYIVSYLYDDTGLFESYVLLLGGEYKKFISHKKYPFGTLSDTIKLAIGDILGGYDEVSLRVVGIDISGKEGYAQLTYKKPSYEDRLKEFMSIKDSIESNENVIANIDELEGYDFKLLKREELSLEDIEKIKMSLEKTQKELESASKRIEEVERIMENLKDIVQDKNLMNTVEEFNKTFTEILREHFKDVFKELANKSIDTMSREELKNYIENIKKRRDEIVEELKKLKDFLKLLKEELDKEEFVSRFENLMEKERYLKDKTQYFEDIKPLVEEQMDISNELDQLKALSENFWQKFEKNLKGLKEQMKNIANSLNTGRRGESLKREEELLNDMEEVANSLKDELNKGRKQRKQASLHRIERLKWDLYFINFVASPQMDTHERGLYKESLKFILSYVDSFDAITYVTVFKAVALLRLSYNFVETNPTLAYGLVNQAIYFLLNTQMSMAQSGGKSEGEELRSMLQKLLTEQGNLTKKVSGMLPVPLPSNSLSSLLSEYGKMQEELRKMAEQLAKLTNIEEVKGALSSALSEMKKAEEDLKSGHVYKETVEHQRKALQHLLRAYRSIRKKDIEKKREATAGKSFIPEIVTIPQELIIHFKVDSLMKYLSTVGRLKDTFIRSYIENLRK